MNKKSNYKGRKPGSKNKVKKAEPTKTKRIPIAIESEIDELINRHKIAKQAKNAVLKKSENISLKSVA